MAPHGLILTIAIALAEVGVLLLMFGVGVHFSLEDLWSVRWVAAPGAIGQIVIATAVTALVVPLWGWTYAQGIVFGLAIAISSTVVLIRTLTDAGLLESAHGKTARSCSCSSCSRRSHRSSAVPEVAARTTCRFGSEPRSPRSRSSAC